MSHLTVSQEDWKITPIYPPSPEFLEILQGRRCPYCLGSTQKLLGHSKQFCKTKHCNASVGLHPTGKPMGALAKRSLRLLRTQAHKHFDKLWKEKAFRQAVATQTASNIHEAEARKEGYQWLSKSLGIPLEFMHIGMLNIEQCRSVIELCLPFSRRIDENRQAKLDILEANFEIDRQQRKQKLDSLSLLELSARLQKRGKKPWKMKESVQQAWNQLNLCEEVLSETLLAECYRWHLAGLNTRDSVNRVWRDRNEMLSNCEQHSDFYL
jgi:hypothetical protein